MYLNDVANWKRADTNHFWAEVAPSEHVVQIYDEDGVLLDALAGFVSVGLRGGDCVIVIATEAHLPALADRLQRLGVDLESAMATEQMISLDAGALLSTFLVDGWPNEALFMETVASLFGKASVRNRRVRAFGEMVAVLWSQGRCGAAVNLEYLWNKVCANRAFSLFCAYPSQGFKTDIAQSISGICKCHSKMIHGSDTTLSEVLYKEVI